MREEFLIFGSPQIEQAEIDEVVDSLKSCWLGTGPKTKRFEEDFAAYKDIPYASALNSCTAGLHLACVALGFQPGDEVITTPMTFCATVNTIIHSGATPVLADIDPQTFNIDPKEIEKKITSKTRAIIPVHFAGRACEMDTIMSIAQQHNLIVIEDCAHAIETEYQGRKAGTFGTIGVFSFYATKNVVTGEGGMVISADADIIDQIKILGLHGMSRHAWQRFSDAGYKHYYVEEAGFKYNMMDIQAAIGIHQLKRVEKNWLRRQEIWQRYNDAFAALPIQLPAKPEPNTRHAYHLYTVLIDQVKTGISRDQFLDAMTLAKIGVGVHYLSIPEHPHYQKTFGWQPTDYPHAMQIGQQTVSLPLTAKLTNEDVEDVIAAVKSAIKI
jgi:dTDP-4-amino-4,6-dideoxygalactose transaminase